MNDLQQRLGIIQSALNCPKNQYNTFGKYKYRSCEDILEGVKPHLLEHGLVLVVSDSMEAVGDRNYVKATAWISDGKDSLSASGWAREPLAKKGMDESQITGAASSYARKYALNGLFCIDDVKDADRGPAPSGDNSKSPKSAANPYQQSNPVDNIKKEFDAKVEKTEKLATAEQVKLVNIICTNRFEVKDRDAKLQRLNGWLAKMFPQHPVIETTKQLSFKAASTFLNAFGEKKDG